MSGFLLPKQSTVYFTNCQLHVDQLDKELRYIKIIYIFSYTCTAWHGNRYRNQSVESKKDYIFDGILA